jgi:hypothetical protein
MTLFTLAMVRDEFLRAPDQARRNVMAFPLIARLTHGFEGLFQIASGPSICRDAPRRRLDLRARPA